MTIQRNWQELIKPTKLEFVSGSDNARVASVVAEPLDQASGVAGVVTLHARELQVRLRLSLA